MVQSFVRPLSGVNDISDDKNERVKGWKVNPEISRNEQKWPDTRIQSAVFRGTFMGHCRKVVGNCGSYQRATRGPLEGH